MSKSYPLSGALRTALVAARSQLSTLKTTVRCSISAIIVGKPQAEAFYDEYNRMLLAVTKKYNLPILTNVNFGHAYPRTALPYGGKMQIDFDRKSLTLTEPIFAQEEKLNR